jgi:hypothetical protein
MPGFEPNSSQGIATSIPTYIIAHSEAQSMQNFAHYLKKDSVSFEV